ncbi:hypothetical protein RA268_29585, partial [Pseudomonas syringae pv. tagetis]
QTGQVLSANGVVHVRQVRSGFSDRLRVQVLDGLNEGVRLLLPSSVGRGCCMHTPMIDLRAIRNSYGCGDSPLVNVLRG